jgi:hypothetical protein
MLIRSSRIHNALSNKEIKINCNVTGCGGPLACQTSTLPHFAENRMTDNGEDVSFTSRPHSTPGIFLVLICVRGCVNPRAIARLERLGQLKISITSPEIETASFQLAAQSLSQLK